MTSLLLSIYHQARQHENKATLEKLFQCINFIISQPCIIFKVVKYPLLCQGSGFKYVHQNYEFS